MGRVEFRAEKNAIIFASVGKVGRCRLPVPELKLCLGSALESKGQ